MNEIITKEEVKEFQRIVLKDYGQKLSYEQAEDQGGGLILLFEALIKGRLDNGK